MFSFRIHLTLLLMGLFLSPGAATAQALAATADAAPAAVKEKGLAGQEPVPPDRSFEPSPPVPYKANYAVLGYNQLPGQRFVDTKFQLSFKKELNSAFNAQPLMFGYTQLAVWDIGRTSAPFRDINFNPELFVETVGQCDAEYRQCRRAQGPFVALPIGVEHESNGRGGPDSRSWNRLYVEPKFETPLSGWRFRFNWKMWWTFQRDKQNNPDIEDYYGFNEWTLQLIRPGREMSARIRLGRKAGRGRIILGLAVPAPGIGAYLYFQGFAGYGETLLEYNQKDTNVRVGLLFTL